MIIQINRHSEDRLALLPSEDEMSDPAFFSQISHILLGTHPHSPMLLQPVDTGTEFSKAKATHYMYICFYSMPKNLVDWIRSIQDHLPPNYYVVGGLDPVTAFLANPQVGSLTLVTVACAKKVNYLTPARVFFATKNNYLFENKLIVSPSLTNPISPN